MFFDTHTDSTIFRYSPGFYHFLVLTLIQPFSGTYPDNFSIPTRILSFPILVWILPFFGTHTDSTLFRYSTGMFFDTHMDSTFFRYSPGFYRFLVLTLIRPFSSTHPDCFSILAWILLFPVLARILPFFGSHIDSTLSLYSPGQFFDTRTDSSFFQYLHWFNPSPVLARIIFSIPIRILPFSVLARILPFFGIHIDSIFSGSRPKCFSILTWILPFSGTRPNSTNFWYSHWFYLFPILSRVLSFSGIHTDSTFFRNSSG